MLIFFHGVFHSNTFFAGELNIIGKVVMTNLTSNAYLLLGQEPDLSTTGDIIYDKFQAFSGKLSDANMWDKALKSEEVHDLHKGICKNETVSHGTVISWPEELTGG